MVKSLEKCMQGISLMSVMCPIGIGAVLLKQGRVDEAKSLLTKAATLPFVKLGARHQQSLDAMNWLAECKSTQKLV